MKNIIQKKLERMFFGRYRSNDRIIYFRILEKIKTKFDKPSKKYTIRSAMKIVISGFGDEEIRRKYAKMFLPISIETRDRQRFKKYSFKSREEASKFLIDSLASDDGERLFNAAYYSVTASFDNLKDEVFIKLLGLILFGNHESSELSKIVCSCSTYLLDANATLIVSFEKGFIFSIIIKNISECCDKI